MCHCNIILLLCAGFSPWQLGGNQTGTDEVFMAAQEAVSAHRDSQGRHAMTMHSYGIINTSRGV